MEKKNLTIVLCFALSVGVFIFIYILGEIQIGLVQLIPIEYVSHFVGIIPGPLITDVLLLFLIPIGFYVLYYFISPYFVVFYVKVHKFLYWLLRRPSKYGIFKLGQKVKAGRIFYCTLIVGLFAFSIAFLLVEVVDPSIFRINMLPIDSDLYILNLAEAVFLGSFAVCSVLIIIFFPIWQLEDSGLVSYRVFHEERMPADIQGVHSVFHHLLLGYAGLSTIFTIVIFVSDIVNKVPELGVAILTPIILILSPFIVTGLLAIPIYLYERYFPKTNERVQAKLANFNFPAIQVPRFEELEE